jgi:nitrate/TMAO reductase-like tetraheme cytochrome c subunit
MKRLNLAQQTKPNEVAAPPAPRRILRWLRWPKISVDLANPRQRFRFVVVLGLLAVVGLALLVGGFKGYEYTESAEFCGTVCHSMDPQWVRFKISPHGNVLCAECHIGPGASFFVKSKIDGLRQVVAEVLDNYHRPIKSPVRNLRPARETCHAPTQFTDNIIKSIRRYDNDAENTPIESTFVLKMGGTNQNTGASHGIHWHVSNEVYYLPLDEQRQVVAWVGVKQEDGSLVEFYSRDLIGMGQASIVEKAREAGQIRQLDCIDCHNRTAHYIPYPEQMVDQAITDGLISRDLPYIRAKAVELLKQPYASESEAFKAIDDLADYYKVSLVSVELLPSSSSSLKADVTEAIAVLKRIYAETNFPDMKLNWETNPNNEKHTPFLGCFRCHDGKHVTIDAEGNEQAISAKCNLCHTVPIVGRGNDLLVEAPVIVGSVPESHADFRWTIEHRNITEADKQTCLNCHGQAFCNNGACHNLSHPTDMLFTHAEEYRKRGEQVCYTCHQNIFCVRCHAAGVINNP